MRWLIRHSAQPMPKEADLARFLERITSAFVTCEGILHIEWAGRRAGRRPRWRQEVKNLRRNPRRLGKFVAQEHLAQLLLYGAARLDATDDLDELIHQMKEDPMFFGRVISAALEEDIVDKDKRLLHDPGGRPKELWRYYPVVHAAARIFGEVTGTPLGRSTSSATLTGSRAPGQAIGPGVQFVKRLLAPLPRRFSDETIAHLIRGASGQ